MSSELFDRYKDLQAYVGWSEGDAVRIRSAAQLIEGQAHLLIDDFYEEIERHPATRRDYWRRSTNYSPQGQLENLAK